MTEKTFQAVVFDIDGLLIKTEHLQYQAWVEALKILYDKKISGDDYKKNYVGNSTKYIAGALGERYPWINVEQLYVLREHLIRDIVKNADYEKMPFAEQAIQYFGLNNVPVAFATGASVDESRVKLERSGLSKIVDDYEIPVIGCDHPDVKKGKPAPDSYLVAIETLGLDPDKSILTFEDTLPGVLSALAAGTTCFAIPNEWTRNSNFPKEAVKHESLLFAINDIHQNYSRQRSLE